MSAGQSFGNTFKKTTDGSVAVNNVSSVFNDTFLTFDSSNKPTTTWEVLIKNDSDIIEIDGNANGARYLKIVKLPFSTGTTILRSREEIKIPYSCKAWVSMSQRVNGQTFNLSLDGVNSSGKVLTTIHPSGGVLVGSAVSQSVSTLTIQTTTPHFLSVGDRVDLANCEDSRFNYTGLLVTAIPDSTTFQSTTTSSGTLPSITAIVPIVTYSPLIYVVGYSCGIEHPVDTLGLMFEGTTSGFGIVYARSGGTEYATAQRSFGSTGTNGTIASSPVSFNRKGTYAWNAQNCFNIRTSYDLVEVGVIPTNGSASSYPVVQSDIIPDERKNYRLTITACNNFSSSLIVAKILLIAKTGTNVATVITTIAHGLFPNDYVTISGVRDITNFPNFGTAAQVSSIIDATTFTIPIGLAGTVSSFGGVVTRVNGNKLLPIQNVSLQTISGDGVFVTVTTSSATTGISIGEHIVMQGVVNSTGSTPSLSEQIYKIYDIVGTTLTLVPGSKDAIKPVIALQNVGGAIIKCTDFRLHSIKLIDYSKTTVEAEPAINRNITQQALSTSGYATIEGINPGPGTAPNPVLVSVRSQTALPSIATSGSQNSCLGTVVGAQIVKPYSLTETEFFNTLTLTTIGNNTVQISPGVTVKRHVTSFWAINTGFLSTDLSILDGTSVRATYPLPPNVPVFMTFPTGINMSFNNALQVNISGLATVRLNISGYTAP